MTTSPRPALATPARARLSPGDLAALLLCGSTSFLTLRRYLRT
jgi:hypothetical protein